MVTEPSLAFPRRSGSNMMSWHLVERLPTQSKGRKDGYRLMKAMLSRGTHIFYVFCITSLDSLHFSKNKWMNELDWRSGLLLSKV